jgi:hypothetical protein
MKKHNQTFILIIFLQIINYANCFAQIEGKWKCNAEKSKTTLYEIEAFKKVKEAAKTDSIAMFAIEMTDAFAGVVMEYKKGGEYIETKTTNNEYVKNKVTVKKGKWEFDSNNKILHTILNGRKEEVVVKSYSKDELILEFRDSNMVLYLSAIE